MNAPSIEQPSSDDIDREPRDGWGPNGETMRVYSYDDIDLPSVTSVLKFKDEDTSALETWKERNDGRGDNPFHKHLFWYARHRGTLAHYAALNPLAERELWSDDEEGSVWELRQLTDKEVKAANVTRVLYSVQNDHGLVDSRGEFYDTFEGMTAGQTALLEQLRTDLQAFIPVWEDLCQRLGITRETVVDVERFLFAPKLGLAGQADLVYEDPATGERVLADLKTSRSLLPKYCRQVATYAEMYPLPIDRIEVIRIAPDEHWNVYTPPETVDTSPVHTTQGRSEWDRWEHSRAALWAECASFLIDIRDQLGPV